MDRRWVYFFADGNVRRGPFTLEQLREYPLRAETMVWREGMPIWSTLREVPELWAVFAEKLVAMPPMMVDAPPPTPEEVALAGGVPQTPILDRAMPPPTLNYAAVDIKPASGAAVTALVTSIAGLIWWCLPGSILVAVPLAITAVVSAVIARKKIKRQEAGGAGIALSALIMGIVNLVVALSLSAVFGTVAFMMWQSSQRAAQPNVAPPAVAPTTVAPTTTTSPS